MGIYVDIDKISEKDGVHCYKVFSADYDCNYFFITIRAGSRKVYFYKDQQCLTLLGNVDFDKDELMRVDGLPSGLVAKAALRAYMAAKRGEFPNSLGIYS